MTKPAGIRWLEEETGQVLDNTHIELGDTRHLSLRVPMTMYASLEALADARTITVSQLARQLINDGLAQHRNPDRSAIDAVIALLDDLRQRLPTSVA